MKPLEFNPRRIKPTLLIVEDNDDLCNFLQACLADQYLIKTAGDGPHAWNMIARYMPDFIVSDIMIPGFDGFELCKQVKSTFKTSHIPVILLTALSEKAKHLEGLGLGAEDYITKPFDVDVLQCKIESILKNRNMLRDNILKLAALYNPKPALDNPMNNRFLKQAFDIVTENLENPDFDKAEFALAMCVSSSLLYKKIKELTGQSPSDFIKIIRMDYALRLLKLDQYRIAEVSDLSGFSSPSIFSRAFKSYFGKAPTEV